MPSTQRKTSLAAREPFRLLSGQEGGLAPRSSLLNSNPGHNNRDS